MIAVTPYYANREVLTTQEDGSTKSSWHPCRVLGVTEDDDCEPVFVVEFVQGGITYLEKEMYVRKMEPGNPL